MSQFDDSWVRYLLRCYRERDAWRKHVSTWEEILQPRNYLRTVVLHECVLQSYSNQTSKAKMPLHASHHGLFSTLILYTYFIRDMLFGMFNTFFGRLNPSLLPKLSKKDLTGRVALITGGNSGNCSNWKHTLSCLTGCRRDWSLYRQISCSAGLYDLFGMSQSWQSQCSSPRDRGSGCVKNIIICQR